MFFPPLFSDQTKLCDLEDTAKAAGKGKWAKETIDPTSIRDIKWTIDNSRNFVDQFHQKPIDGKSMNHVYRSIMEIM